MQSNVLASLSIHVAIGIDERPDRPNLYYNIMQSKIGIKYPGGTPSPLDFLVTDWLDDPTKIPKSLIYFDSKTTLRHFRDRLRALLPSHWIDKQRKLIIQGYYSYRSSDR